MEIYYYNINDLRNRDLFNEKLTEIDSKRADKISRMKNSGDKIRSLAAGLLINFIKDTYNIRGHIHTDKYGKPYFTRTKIKFNLSHSGNYVVAAVSKGKIGIDIQRIENEKHRIAERNFLPSECQYINRINDEKVKAQRFCEMWTIKEAYLKNLGIGLRKPLNSFEIYMNMGAPRVIGRPELRIVQIKLDERYIVAVCADKRDEELNVKELAI